MKFSKKGEVGIWCLWYTLFYDNIIEMISQRFLLENISSNLQIVVQATPHVGLKSKIIKKSVGGGDGA
jgi:hypothetical protein